MHRLAKHLLAHRALVAALECVECGDYEAAIQYITVGVHDIHREMAGKYYFIPMPGDAVLYASADSVDCFRRNEIDPTSEVIKPPEGGR